MATPKIFTMDIVTKEINKEQAERAEKKKLSKIESDKLRNNAPLYE